MSDERAPLPRCTVRKCGNCEYFDGFNGDCLNNNSPRFQTTPSNYCQHFYPNSTRFLAPLRSGTPETP